MNKSQSCVKVHPQFHFLNSRNIFSYLQTILAVTMRFVSSRNSARRTWISTTSFRNLTKKNPRLRLSLICCETRWVLCSKNWLFRKLYLPLHFRFATERREVFVVTCVEMREKSVGIRSNVEPSQANWTKYNQSKSTIQKVSEFTMSSSQTCAVKISFAVENFFGHFVKIGKYP